MKLRRENKLMVESPAVATGDIAFNLIVFFLVCASTQPNSGRKQDIPRSDPKQQQDEQSQNIDVRLTKTAVFVNGDLTAPEQFQAKMFALLQTKPRMEDKVVVVKSEDDTPYDHWVRVTGQIGDAGGIVTLQLEEEQTVVGN